jgi:hypothetical protein
MNYEHEFLQSPNITIMTELLLCAWDVPGSNLDPPTGILTFRVLVFFLSLSRQIPEHYITLGHACFLPHPFHLISH